MAVYTFVREDSPENFPMVLSEITIEKKFILLPFCFAKGGLL